MSCVVGFYRSQSQHIVAQASQAFTKVEHVRLCCELAGFCCEGWDCLWSLVSIHRVASSAVVRPANTCMETRRNYPELVDSVIGRTSAHCDWLTFSPTCSKDCATFNSYSAKRGWLIVSGVGFRVKWLRASFWRELTAEMISTDCISPLTPESGSTTYKMKIEFMETNSHAIQHHVPHSSSLKHDMHKNNKIIIVLKTFSNKTLYLAVK